MVFIYLIELDKYKKNIKNKAYCTLFYKEQLKYLKTAHSYHLVDSSPWPFVASIGGFMLTKGLKLAMFLFIVSEIMFFFAFFWSFFHSSITSVYNVGSVWSPKAITSRNTHTLPLTNTFILLTSGATVTWFHHALIERANK